MNFKTKAVTLVAASFVALSISAGAMAQDATVSQEVTGGAFTQSLTDGTLDPIVFDYTNTVEYVQSGSLTLNVNDGRGTKEGWSVAISSTAFDYAGSAPGDNDIPANLFSVLPDAPTMVAGESLIGVNAGLGGTLNEAATVITAASGSGSGEYTQNLPVKLSVPAASPTGTYTATLTVATSAAPA